MRPRKHEETAVLDALAPEREPRRYELRTVERPVADVAVPAGETGEARVLGHHAVVVRLRKLYVRTEQLRERRGEQRRSGPFAVGVVACISLKQPAHGSTAG